MVGKSYDISYPDGWKIIWYIIPLWLESHMIYHTPTVGKSYGISYPDGWKIIWYIIPLWLENHMVYHTPTVGKSYGISYTYGWKIIWYFIPRWLENHTLFIHLHEIYCTFAVGKSSFKLGTHQMNFMNIWSSFIPLNSSIWDEFHHITGWNLSIRNIYNIPISQKEG